MDLLRTNVLIPPNYILLTHTESNFTNFCNLLLTLSTLYHVSPPPFANSLLHFSNSKKFFLILCQNHNLIQLTWFLTLCLCARAFFCILENAPCCRTFKCQNIILTSHWFWTHSLIVPCVDSCLFYLLVIKCSNW